MKTFLYLTIFISVLCVFGCGSNSDLNNQVEIDLRNTPIDKLDFDTSNGVFSKHDFIFPIKAIQDSKGNLYVWDMGFGKVYNVTTDSLYMIGNSGLGPGEYVEVNELSFDEINQEIIIHDIEQAKLLFFDEEFNFSKEVSMPIYFEQIQRLKNGDFGLYTSSDNLIGGILNMHNFVVTDSSFSSIKHSMISYNDTLNSIELGKHYFEEIGEEIFLLYPFDERIYVLDEDSYALNKAINLRFSSLQGMARYNDIAELEELYDLVFDEESQFKGLPFNIYHSENYLMFQFMNSTKRAFGLIDLTDFTTKLFQFNGDSAFYPDFVLGVYQDQFLVRVPVEDRYGLYLLDPAAYFNQN